MADVTVKQFAQTVGVPVERLLSQLQEAGISIDDGDHSINDEQKRTLLNYLKGKGGGKAKAAPGRITLRRKSVSQVTDTQGSKKVNVEVRKKRTYVKRELLEQEAEPEVADVEEPDVEKTSHEESHIDPVDSHEEQASDAETKSDTDAEEHKEVSADETDVDDETSSSKEGSVATTQSSEEAKSENQETETTENIAIEKEADASEGEKSVNKNKG